jgi:hypothetical protein
MARKRRFRIKCNSNNVTAVRVRIEHKLGVETQAESQAWGVWYVSFEAPADVNLDFLIPDVIQPK